MKISTPFFEKEVKPTYDSDAIDRLSYFTTVFILIGCAAFIMAKQYVGESIQCWAPKQFGGGWESYAETYCLIENTYFVNTNNTNLPADSTRENMELRYYQWVPFILLGLALALYIPRLVWSTLQSVIGVNISIITSHVRNNAISGLSSANAEDIEKKRKEMQNKKKFEKEEKFIGSPLTFCMMTTKFLTIIVIFVTMIFLDAFMGLGPLYGWTVTMDVIQGRQWQESGTFPRVTFCDFQVRELGHVNNWSLQCVLMVNMFNEKLFIGLWWWFSTLFVLSIYNVFRFFWRFTIHNQASFISTVLSILNDSSDIHKEDVVEFNRKVLKIDGIMLTHLIYDNSTIFEAAEFLRPIWQKYKSDNHQQ